MPVFLYSSKILMLTDYDPVTLFARIRVMTLEFRTLKMLIGLLAFLPESNPRRICRR